MAPKGGNYYNEFDPFAAEWLRELIKAGLIADGEVDTRSIVNVSADDLRGFTQCHFFAGIGVWSYALRLAGWPDDRPVWTGSCPCQPFSVAGKREGKNDSRHLWPELHRLIVQRRPHVIFGEQVSGAAGRDWFDGVADDFKANNYTSEAFNLSACSVNAPHIRQRLYWVATNMGDTNDERLSGCGRLIDQHGEKKRDNTERRSPTASVLSREEYKSSHMADAECRGRQSGSVTTADAATEFFAKDSRGYWHDAIWLTGADGKTRRSKPGIRLLVDGATNRVGRLRGYGNAIVAPLAAEVIRAFMDTEG